jgi:hypothetical protein
MQVSAKNILQEFCQRKKIPFPIYDSKRTGGTAHEPIWECVCTLNIDGETLQEKSTSSNKTTGQLLCAQQLLNKMSDLAPPKKLFNGNSVILIDVENIPQILEELETFDFQGNEDKSSVYLFHSQNFTLKQFFPGVKVCSIKSSLKDSVDIAIQLKVGELLNTTESFVIITRDHFAHSLREILIHNYNKKAIVAHSLLDICDIN